MQHMPQHMLQHTLLRTQLCVAATLRVVECIAVVECAVTRPVACNYSVDSVTEGLQHALQQTCHAATYTATYTARIYIHLLVGGVTEERVVWFPTHTRTDQPVHILQKTLQQI